VEHASCAQSVEMVGATEVIAQRKLQLASDLQHVALAADPEILMLQHEHSLIESPATCC
jgi:hypothetical protein